MFENKLIREIHATRYIMSWIRSGGTLTRLGGGYDLFREWLVSLGLTETEIHEIMYLAFEGKLELETSAKKFINKN